mmetsp:Transcript_48012/g.86845  ORF Transcript_48012/g.86845 Transcript_48012/m.86845 type:complete len:298 (-) Transcript_48012:582-1475(-)
MYFRYSETVVAPMHCSSPRARAGLSRFAASMAPSAAPAPTSVWISSMKRMMSSAAVTSSMTSRRRCSNSPLYFVSATSSPSSSESTVVFCSRGGTLPSAISIASPSAMAVLPTPGSPIKTGLFLRRRTRICIARFTSSPRPMRGSNSPSRAFWVRSTEHFDSVDSPFFFCFLGPPAPTSSRLPFLTTAATVFAFKLISLRSLTAKQPSVFNITCITSFHEISSSLRSCLANWTAAFSTSSVSVANGRSSSLDAKRRLRPGVLAFPPAIWLRTLAFVTPARSKEACTSSFCIVAASSR